MVKLTDFDEKRKGADFRLTQCSKNSDFLSGLSVTQSQLARLFGVTKQAVNAWVRDKKIKVNAIGRIDPNEALIDLLTGTDPSRLRASLLRPVHDEITRLTEEKKNLAARLETALSDVEFHKEAGNELLNILTALERRLNREWHLLSGVDPHHALAAISDWIEESMVSQQNIEKNIVDYLSQPAPVHRDEKEGGGGAA